MLSNNALKKIFREQCQKLGASEEKFRYRSYPAHDGSAHVEIDKNGYHYIVTERGQELKRKTTLDPDELLYWLLSDVIFFMASKYELANRIYSQDSRRILFAKEVDLFKQLKQEWANRKQSEINKILESHPYAQQY